jgi:hypothetical protein
LKPEIVLYGNNTTFDIENNSLMQIKLHPHKVHDCATVHIDHRLSGSAATAHTDLPIINTIAAKHKSAHLTAPTCRLLPPKPQAPAAKRNDPAQE